MRKLATLVASLALLAAVGTTSIASAHAAPMPTPASNGSTVVTVQPGDTLSGIAQAHNTTYKRLFDANESISNPDQIAPGEQIRIPTADEQLPDRALPGTTVAQPASPEASAPIKQASADATTSGDDGVWDKIALCESGGNWSINTGNGFYGGLQFTLSSWQAVGGSGLPSDASREEQITRAKTLQSQQGWNAWPVCSHKAGM